MSINKVESMISNLGIVQVLNFISEICEDKVTDYTLSISSFDCFPIDFNENFNEQMARELSEEFDMESNIFIQAYDQYHHAIKSIEAGKIIIKTLRSIEPNLQKEDLFRNNNETQKMFHRDKYETYNQLVVMISKLGVITVLEFLIKICDFRTQETEFFYFDYGIFGEWQEWQRIADKLRYLPYGYIPKDLFKK